MFIRIKEFILKYKLAITASLSFLIPFIMYLLTLEHKVVGGDTTWYALQLPEMMVLVPTGYPTFSLIGKLMSMVPIGDLAYRLNLISAIFGALTILFLFLAVNKLTKNEIISVAGSLSFAFVLTFWSLSVRLEFDTLNSFFIALIIFAAFLFNESKLRRHLYFFFLCLGLSLTNHPIALFVMPAFLLYIIIINPRVFKSFKVISLCILFFILPLLLYLYIPIRSLQGYGTANTLKEFLYYITGRTTTGKTFGGSFGNNSIQVVLQVFKDFILIIYKNFGIILIAVAIIGFVYLIKKNWKFAISSLFVPILSMVIISQYLGWSPQNYTIDSMIILTFYISFGFLFIFDLFLLLLNKLQKRKNIFREKIFRQPTILIIVKENHNNENSFNKETMPEKDFKKSPLKRNQFLKYLTTIIIFLFFISQPTLLAITNYKKADLSKPEGIYLFWDKAFKDMEKNSVVYVFARSANIGAFINLYEQKSKGVKFITNNDPEYTINNMKENLKNGKTIYFVGTDTKLKQFFSMQQIGESYFWPRYKENLVFYKIIDEFNINIEYVIDSKIKKFGDKFNLEYIVKNDSNMDIKITSFELSLPNNIMFLDVIDKGYIKQGPGLSKGKYIWVSDSYIIKPHSSINLIVELRGKSTGKSIIKFRLTTQDIYFESNDLEIEITN
jgi:hypothetical protein